MDKAEAIQFFTQQAKDEQDWMEILLTMPQDCPAFTEDRDGYRKQSIEACQADIDACTLAIEALKKE